MPKKKRIFIPWLPHWGPCGKPGEQKRPKTKGLQPLKGLNAKASFSFFKFNPWLKPGAINPHYSRALAINLFFTGHFFNRTGMRERREQI